MKAMLNSMYDGYNTLTKGYGQITSLAKGNYDLHKGYLDGLAQVSPAVKRYKKIGNIITNQVELVNEFKNSYSEWQSAGLFNATDLLTMKAFGDGLVDKAGECLDELLMVVTPGILKMNDEERIGAIDRIDLALTDQLKSVKAFIKANNELAKHREQTKRDIEVMRKLNGVN